MDTLTDRYIWAVTRGVPHDSRKSVGDHLRAELGARVGDKLAAGVDPEIAESEALGEFGDPDRRAAEASGRPAYLIGPAYFFDYRRLMIIVLSAVTPSVFGALLLAQLIGGSTAWAALLTAVSVAVTVAVQVGFWLTVAFAVIERTAKGRRRAPDTWDPADLPQVPTTKVGLGETVFALLAYLLFVGLVLWQQNIWVVEPAGGERVPLLDSDLWSFWIPWFLVLAVLEMAFALVLYAAQRWTWTLAWVNVVLNLAFAVPAVALVASGEVLSTQFRTAFAEFMPLVQMLVTILPVVIIGVAILDIVQGFRRAYRAMNPALPS